MLTARAENHNRGNPDLDDTIARLQAFEAAGADVLFAPGLRSPIEIRGVRSRLETRERISATGTVPGGDGGGGRAARQRRRRPHLGRGQRAGGRRRRDSRSRRLLLACSGPSSTRTIVTKSASRASQIASFSTAQMTSAAIPNSLRHGQLPTLPAGRPVGGCTSIWTCLTERSSALAAPPAIR
jgi:Phosphoenolpyruvate phosphomutase